MTYVPAQLRRFVVDRAAGCCEYCLFSQESSDTTFHVEHIVAVFHGGQTVESNLALSCSRCNLYKGSNIAAADPETGDPTFLFHPRRHIWEEHFRLEDVTVVPLTAEGRTTEFVLKLNENERIAERALLLELGEYPCNK